MGGFVVDSMKHNSMSAQRSFKVLHGPVTPTSATFQHCVCVIHMGKYCQPRRGVGPKFASEFLRGAINVESVFAHNDMSREFRAMGGLQRGSYVSGGWQATCPLCVSVEEKHSLPSGVFFQLVRCDVVFAASFLLDNSRNTILDINKADPFVVILYSGTELFTDMTPVEMRDTVDDLVTGKPMFVLFDRVFS